MRFNILVSLFISWACASAQAQPVYWKQERPLNFSDFKGMPDSNSRFYALTYSEINQSYKSDDYGIQISITHAFVPEKSWMKKEDADSALLAHEQRHFDLSELYSRKMQYEVKKLSYSKKFPDEFKKIIQKNIDEMNEEHDRYDRETQHGLKKAEQSLWNVKIKTAFEKYTEPLSPFYIKMD